MYQIFKIFSIMIFVWVHRLLKFLGKFTVASDLIHPSSSQETLTDCIQAIVQHLAEKFFTTYLSLPFIVCYLMSSLHFSRQQGVQCDLFAYKRESLERMQILVFYRNIHHLNFQLKHKSGNDLFIFRISRHFFFDFLSIVSN